MNSASSESPRFSCRIARGLLATLGRTDSTSPRGLGSSHVAECPDCQHFFAACDELDLALTRDAAHLSKDVPAGLERRIAVAVARSTPARPEPARSGLPLFALVGAAACAAVAVFVFQTKEEPAESETPTTNIVAVIDSTREALATHPLRTKVLDTLDSATSELMQDDPLTTEAKAIQADARSALRFLALNFLPSTPESLENRPPRRSNSG